MHGFEQIVVAISLMMLVVLGSYAGGEIVFAPLRRAERAIGRRLRFGLADLAVLVFHLQLASAALLVMLPGERVVDRAVWIPSAWMVVLCWWVHGLSLLAEAGAERAPHRMLFLAFVAPLGYTGVLLLAPAVLMLVTTGFVCLIVTATGEQALATSQVTLFLALLVLFAALLFAAALGARLASLWLVRGART